MKLVLLPGMDGTGKLFEDFLSFYDGDHQVIPLPEEGGQSTNELAKYILSHLPSENIILLAESFSGSIVPSLLKKSDSNIKGVIFVASFISCPNPVLVSIARYLPIKLLARIPGAGLFHRFFFLGSSVSTKTLNKFCNVIDSLPTQTLINRLKNMKNLPKRFSFSTDIPCVYLKPTRDKLVPKAKMVQIESVFNNSSHTYIDGPHFILQSKPEEMAAQIRLAVQDLTKHSAATASQ